MKLLLASGSPRRRELLGQLGLEFSAVPSAVEERAPHPGESPANYVLSLAREKAEDVAARFPEDVVLGADTDVALEGAILGKPRDEAHAIRMLELLRGKTHVVTTALVSVCGGRELEGTVEARVTMRDYARTEVESYVAGGEPMDKAGAYAVQGEGGALVARVDGCYRTVVGLPLCLAFDLLSRCGLQPVRPRAGWCAHCDTVAH